MPSRPFLTAEWRDLVMINYEIDPLALRSLVPAGVELDRFDGRTLVSMVGFRFLNTKVLGLAVPGHRDFDEVNLRFYVRRLAPEGWRRGVVFVKEIVPRAAIAWVARVVYGERYVALPMRHDVVLGPDAPGGEGHARYDWRSAGRWNRLGAEVAGSPAIPAEDSEAAFITEHYWGYASARDGSAWEYQVDHPRWRVWSATRAEFDCEVSAIYGAEFIDALAAAPSSAFVADGSAVAVHKKAPPGSPHRD
jgi:hypothetical protein